MNLPRNYLYTGSILLLAAVLIVLSYWRFLVNPWTRDGQVRAEVIQITPRVSGPIVDLPVQDNQFVNAGDSLFVLDPRTFEAALAKAQAQYDESLDNYQAMEKQVEAAEASVDVYRAGIVQAQSAIRQLDAEIAKYTAELQRQQELLPERATSQKSVDRAKANYDSALQQREGAVASLAQARASLIQSEADLAQTRANLGAPGAANATIRAARAALTEAELNMEFSAVTAPVDGYVTNLNLRLGSNTVANQPALALIDTSSFWIQAFFKETSVADIRKGDKAVVTLMAYSDSPLDGFVDSIGWGIAQQDGTTGFELLPNVSPTFEWIRLAERLPVRIHLDEIPKDIELRAGLTASVLVQTNSGDSE